MGGDGAPVRVGMCAERSLHKRKVWIHTTDKKRSPDSHQKPSPKPRNGRADLALRQSDLEVTTPKSDFRRDSAGC